MCAAVLHLAEYLESPVEEPALRDKLERLLDLYLRDNRGAWDMQADGTFVQCQPKEGEQECNSQIALIDLWRKGIPSS